MAESSIKNLIECPNCLKKFEFGSSYLDSLNGSLHLLRDIQKSNEKLRKAVSDYKASNDESHCSNSISTQPMLSNSLILLESELDEFSNSAKQKLAKCVADLSIIRDWLDNCCSHTPDSSTPEFTYDEKQRMRIGRPLDGITRSRLGPLEKLDQNGSCEFIISERYTDTWSDIADRNVGEISCRPILLPKNLSGLAVRVVLCGMGDKKADRIKVSLHAHLNDENKIIHLPAKIALQIRMELIENKLFESEIHEFTVEKLHAYAIPDSFYIHLVRDIKSSHIITNKLPKIWLKFSKW